MGTYLGLLGPTTTPSPFTYTSFKIMNHPLTLIASSTCSRHTPAPVSSSVSGDAWSAFLLRLRNDCWSVLVCTCHSCFVFFTQHFLYLQQSSQHCFLVLVVIINNVSCCEQHGWSLVSVHCPSSCDSHPLSLVLFTRITGHSFEDAASNDCQHYAS